MARDVFVLPRSWHPPGGQGQPYDDDVVAMARSLMMGTDLTMKEVAAQVGVSQMTICRWSRAGRWRLPRRRPDIDAYGRSRAAMERALLRPDPWARLLEAERLLAVLERRDGPDLDEIERALALLLAARRDHARPRARPRKPRAGPP